MLHSGGLNDLARYPELGTRTQAAHSNLRILHKEVGIRFWKGEVAKDQVTIVCRPDQEHPPANRPNSLLNSAPRDFEREPRSKRQNVRLGRAITIEAKDRS